MDYRINLGGWSRIFAVPSDVVDRYIKLASGNNLKVLLCFLRYSGDSISIADIAEKTGLDGEAVSDGLLFWEQVGLLKTAGEGELLPSDKAPAMAGASVSAVSAPIPSAKRIEPIREPRFLPKDIASSVRGSEKMDYLFKQCEQLFGRPLNHNEQNTLMIITEDLAIPVEVALMLIQYCSSVGKASPAYMKAIAHTWAEREITTISAAETEITRMKDQHSAEYELRRRFEMTTAFSKSQKEDIARWTGEYMLPIDTIEEAFQMTLDSLGKFSFPYMRKIIEQNYKNGITTAEGMRKSRDDRKQSIAEESKPSFDLEELDELALAKYRNAAETK